MRKFCFSSQFCRFIVLISILYLIAAPAFSADDVQPHIDPGISMEPVDVTFSFLDRIVYGFTATEPEDLETRIQDSSSSDLEFLMKWNDTQQRYETDLFYFFVQLFTQNSVRIDYKITRLDGESGTDYIPFHVSILDTDATEGTLPNVVNVKGEEVSGSLPSLDTTRYFPESKCWELQAYLNRS